VKAATNNFTVKTFTGKKLFCSLADGSNETAVSTATGTLYALKSVAVGDQGKVDFIYRYISVTSPATMYSPICISGIDPVTSWTTKNDTKFADITDVLSATVFDALTDEALIANITSTEATNMPAPTATSITLVKDHVYSFLTSVSTVGIFKVTDLKTGFTATDYVTITIKTVWPVAQ
jgi:hypothetical protein